MLYRGDRPSPVGRTQRGIDLYGLPERQGRRVERRQCYAVLRELGVADQTGFGRQIHDLFAPRLACWPDSQYALYAVQNGVTVERPGRRPDLLQRRAGVVWAVQHARYAAVFQPVGR